MVFEKYVGKFNASVGNIGYGVIGINNCRLFVKNFDAALAEALDIVSITKPC